MSESGDDCLVVFEKQPVLVPSSFHREILEYAIEWERRQGLPQTIFSVIPVINVRDDDLEDSPNDLISTSTSSVQTDSPASPVLRPSVAMPEPEEEEPMPFRSPQASISPTVPTNERDFSHHYAEALDSTQAASGDSCANLTSAVNPTNPLLLKIYATCRNGGTCASSDQSSGSGLGQHFNQQSAVAVSTGNLSRLPDYDNPVAATSQIACIESDDAASLSIDDDINLKPDVNCGGDDGNLNDNDMNCEGNDLNCDGDDINLNDKMNCEFNDFNCNGDGVNLNGDYINSGGEEINSDGVEINSNADDINCDDSDINSDGDINLNDNMNCEDNDSDGDSINLNSDDTHSDGGQINSDGEEINSDAEEIISDGEEINSDGGQINSDEDEINSDGEEINSDAEEINSVAEEINCDAEEINSGAEEINSDGNDINSSSNHISSYEDDINSVGSAAEWQSDWESGDNDDDPRGVVQELRADCDGGNRLVSADDVSSYDDESDAEIDGGHVNFAPVASTSSASFLNAGNFASTSAGASSGFYPSLVEHLAGLPEIRERIARLDEFEDRFAAYNGEGSGALGEIGGMARDVDNGPQAILDAVRALIRTNDPTSCNNLPAEGEPDEIGEDSDDDNIVFSNDEDRPWAPSWEQLEELHADGPMSKKRKRRRSIDGSREWTGTEEADLLAQIQAIAEERALRSLSPDNIPKPKRRRGPRAKHSHDPNDPNLLLPLDLGWRRLLVRRRFAPTVVDVYYRPPSLQVKFRSLPEVEEYLKNHQELAGALTAENFSFGDVILNHRNQKYRLSHPTLGNFIKTPKAERIAKRRSQPLSAAQLEEVPADASSNPAPDGRARRPSERARNGPGEMPAAAVEEDANPTLNSIDADDVNEMQCEIFDTDGNLILPNMASLTRDVIDGASSMTLD